MTSSLTRSVSRGFSGEARREDGVFSRKAAGGVGEESVPVSVNVIEEALARCRVQLDAAKRHGDELGPGGVERLSHAVEIWILPSADDEAGGEFVRAD